MVLVLAIMAILHVLAACNICRDKLLPLSTLYLLRDSLRQLGTRGSHDPSESLSVGGSAQSARNHYMGWVLGQHRGTTLESTVPR